MKHILITSAVLLGFASSPAFAQSTVTVYGKIAPTCSSLSPASKALGDLTGSGIGSLDASKVNVEVSNLGTITCNSAGTTVSVDANPLRAKTALSDAAKGAGFVNEINYTASVKKVGTAYSSLVSADVLASNATSSAATQNVPVGLINGGFTVNISEANAAGVLIASDYEGTITVTLTAGT